MKLKAKILNVETGGPLISILTKKDALKLDLHPLNRVRLRHKNKEIISVINITQGTLKPGNILLYSEVAKELRVKNNNHIDILYEPNPESVNIILKKVQGKTLSYEEIDTLIKDLLANKLSEIELTYFISACYPDKLTKNEIFYLTRAIAKNGQSLNLGRKIILDKHCIGGIPGNKTTMVIVPIIASLGYTMPKTSSRSISSPSGTADAMEVLAPVELTVEKLKKVVRKTNACIAWGGAMNLASADDKLIKLRHPLSIDPEGLLVASIMAKKMAAGATHILIDIPIGKKAKIKTRKEALSLKQKFLWIGKKLKINIRVIFTDGNNPIGKGIGPALSARDALEVLLNNGPKDLREKSIKLATFLLEMISYKNPKQAVINSLEKGLAYKKMKQIIKAQGGNIAKPAQIRPAKYKKTIFSKTSGAVISFNIKTIKRIARIAGAPFDKKAGIFLYAELKQKVKKGDRLFTIYAESTEKLEQAIKVLNQMKPIAEIR